MAFSMKPLNFCKLVYISAIFSNFLEISKSSLSLNMKKEDFEYILSWEAGNSSRMPVCYTVMYQYFTERIVGCNLHTTGTKSKSAVRDQEQVNFYNSRSQKNQDSDHHVLGPGELAACPAFSETDAQITPMKQYLSDIKSNFKTVQECTNITRLFCNLTNEFADFCQGNAIIIVRQDTSNGTNYSDVQTFNPYFDRCFKPPQFNISVCQNCVNVTVKLSPLLLKIYQKLNYRIIVKTAELKENRIDNTTEKDHFFTILEDLPPNKNYCIAVQVDTGVNHQCNSTNPKCIMLDSNNREDYMMLSILAPSILLVVVVIPVFLHKTGFISCKRKTSPSVLNIKPNLAYSVFESAPEEVCDIQVQKSKVQHHSDDENSESDVESNFDTKCGIFNQIKPFSEVDIGQKLFTGCSATTNEITRAKIDQNDIDKSSPFTPLYPSEVNSGHVAESERTDCLNVNLNSVMLGISDKEMDFSTFDHEDIDLNESCSLDAFEPNHFTEMPDNQSFDVQSPLCSWENLSVSGESESSYSETECTSGYMRR
ncbi:interferon alpha/beta receptor 2 [Ahaetulla prasina]|uniref:interferon alpha/beta receptor 2 n=1 Tax=Ahaetulla prasina TaxID=499056 RepID=UPI00264A26B8|nr:interferon alpha/beta receptor 2 [Ahaetulla prasina]XP_058041484.1 interferon alpha/beta receptor 2 [Ahaetulla prasina]